MSLAFRFLLRRASRLSKGSDFYSLSLGLRAPSYALGFSNHDMQPDRLGAPLKSDELLLDETVLIVVRDVACCTGFQIGWATFEISL